ncbi:HET-domain-containing protein [Thozetella sp. PMI_491]|nr:HET-domain-containing protein [Thozetella sp. PMI_491]
MKTAVLRALWLVFVTTAGESSVAKALGLDLSGVCVADDNPYFLCEYATEAVCGYQASQYAELTLLHGASYAQLVAEDCTAQQALGAELAPHETDTRPSNFLYELLLEDDAIRLLVLAPGIDDEPLRCTLETVTLDDHGPYETISYVWGTPSRTEPIECNGKAMLITPNLRDALLRVRQPHQPRTLWADSICINQFNLAERSRQVSMMARIYRQSTRVLIHVGSNQSVLAPSARALLERIDLYVDYTMGQTGDDWDGFPHLSERALENLALDTRWHSVAAMISQPWFSRGWVVQEASLAPDGVLIWGDTEIRWIAILRVFLWLEHRGVPVWRRHDLQLNSAHMEMYRFEHTRQYVKLLPRSRWYPSLAPQFMDVFRELRMTDPRDRVYAVLGLLTWLYPGSIVVEPNYDKTVDEVYIDFATSWLSRNGESRLLGFGVVIDEVQYASVKFGPIISFDHIIALWQTVLHSRSRFPYAMNRLTLFFVHTLTASKYKTDWFEWRAHQAAFILRLAIATDMVLDDSHGRWLEHTAKGADWNEVLHLAGVMLRGRRFIVTNLGYFGLAPGITQEGDTCSVIFSASTHFILRRADERENYFRLVGEAWIASTAMDLDYGWGKVACFGSRPKYDWIELGLQEQDIFLL